MQYPYLTLMNLQHFNAYLLSPSTFSCPYFFVVFCINGVDLSWPSLYSLVVLISVGPVCEMPFVVPDKLDSFPEPYPRFDYAENAPATYHVSRTCSEHVWRRWLRSGSLRYFDP